MAGDNLQLVLAERPDGDIVPGKTFSRKREPIPSADSLKDGQILVENIYLSLDPAMRIWIRDKRSYTPPVPVGDVMRGINVSRVLASKNDKVKRGDIVRAFGGWQEYAVVNPGSFEVPPKDFDPSRMTELLTVQGFTSLTAYFGLLKIGEPKAGETVVVSGAAGATGSVVGQIAKIKGARVIGIAGGEEKVKYITEELGFDVGLDYKDPDFKEKFLEATKDYIDVYFDNVGGEILDLALHQAKEFSRFVMCGGISQYNTPDPKGPKNIMNVVTMRIKMQGFLVPDFAAEFGPAREELDKWAKEGKLKVEQTIIKGGLDVADKAFADLFKGVNKGKLLVEIKNPQELSEL